MIPVLRSLVSATCWLLHVWPRNTEVHQTIVQCEQRRTRKRFILEQYDRRVQSVRAASRGAERQQPSTRVQQANPVAGPLFQARGVLRPDVRAVHVLSMRDSPAPLICQPRSWQVQEQPIEREGPRGGGDRIALQVLERDRLRQIERSAACPAQGFQARPHAQRLTDRVRKRAYVKAG